MIFVDRKKELDFLENLFKLRLNGTQTFVLVYGLRRVGKTMLVDKFLENKTGVLVDCSSMVSGSDFFSGIYAALVEMGLESEVIGKYEGLYNNPLDDDFKMIDYAFKMLNELAEELGSLIIALDELQGFIENFSRLRNTSQELNRSRLLWKLRESFQKLNTNVFLIVLTSTSFIFEKYSKADEAFMGLFQKLEVRPLTKEASKELAKKLLDSVSTEYTDVAVDKIADLSGGIPKLVEIIVGSLITNKKIDLEKVITTTKELLLGGEFDDFFEAYISFIADFSKWDKTTILRVLRGIAEGKKPKEIAKLIKLHYNTILNILVDLRKMRIIAKQNEIIYPLFREWLLAKKHPPTGRRRIDLLLRALGITFEAYVRELISEIKRRVVLEGEKLFFGTTNKLVLEPIEYVKSDYEADFIAHQENCEYIIGEIKLGQITKSEINKLHQRAEKYRNRGVVKVLAIAKTADPLAVAEAVRKGIIIMSHEAIRKLAKKLKKTPVKI